MFGKVYIYSNTHPLTRSQKYPPSYKCHINTPILRVWYQVKKTPKSCANTLYHARERGKRRGFRLVAAARHLQSARPHSMDFFPPNFSHVQAVSIRLFSFLYKSRVQILFEQFDVSIWLQIFNNICLNLTFLICKYVRLHGSWWRQTRVAVYSCSQSCPDLRQFAKYAPARLTTRTLQQTPFLGIKIPFPTDSQELPRKTSKISAKRLGFPQIRLVPGNDAVPPVVKPNSGSPTFLIWECPLLTSFVC